MPKFRDIPQFSRANYRITVPWGMLESTLESYNEGGMLQLSPEFQRAHVWTTMQQVKYVEFCLRGGTSSREIFFNQADWMRGYKAPMYLVDGKQRIEAVRAFLRDEIPAFGYDFSAYEDRLSLTDGFYFNVNNLKTYAEVLQWYIDLNTGGTVHTDEEIARVRALLERENNGN